MINEDTHICSSRECYLSHKAGWLNNLKGTRYSVTFTRNNASVVFKVNAATRDEAIVQATKEFLETIGADALSDWHYRSAFRD